MDASQKSPVNSSTTIKKYYAVKTSSSTSPSWKSEKETWKSENDNWNAKDTSVSQLDTLLMDLKNERNISRDQDVYEATRKNNNFRTIEREVVTRDSKRGYSPLRTYQYQTNKEEVILDAGDYDDTAFSPPSNSTMRNESHLYTTKQIYDAKEPQRFDTYQTIDRKSDQLVQSRAPSRAMSPSMSTNVLETDLQNLKLGEDILPVPGTKVTTTVRTYTYEVPAEGNPYSTIKRDVHVEDVTSTLNRRNDGLYQSGRSLPENNVHNTIKRDVHVENVSSSTLNRRNDVLYQSGRHVPSESPHHNTIHRDIHVEDISSTINRRNDVYPPGRSLSTTPQPDHGSTINRKLTYTTKTSHIVDENDPLLVDESSSNKYMTKRHIMVPVLPVNNETSNSYYYNNEVRSTQVPSHVPSQVPTHPHPDHYTVSSSTNIRRNEIVPNKPTLVSYEFTSTKNTVDSRALPEPRNGHLNNNPAQPPKQLNELLNTFPNGTNGTQSQSTVDGGGYHPKREVETAVATEYKFDNKTPTKNIAGPPVYYPPNHEMTLRREESSAGYRAGGGWAKARGKYEYEAESKSKSKSSSGGAVVPVCLPLCCAMPCSIM